MTHARRILRWLPLAALVSALAGCPPAPPATDDGGIDAGCAGLIGCECVAGACTTGECLGGTCTDCRRGEAACTCRANGTCNTGLRCGTGVCETCPAGEASCPCGAGDTCGTGLVCSNGTCVADTCTAGTEACPCRAGDPKCDGSAYCDTSTVCRACSNDVLGCPCVSGVCTGATVCDTGSVLCRAPVTCAQLRAAGTCVPNQECLEANGADATCTAMTCVADYKWDGMACVACVSAGCASEPTCAAGDAGIGDACAAQNRACVTMGANSTCGQCLAGFAVSAQPDGGTACVPVPTCGGATCAVTEYCDTTGAPTCLALPCPAGQAKGTTGVCSTCPVCSGPGFSGRVWPFKTSLDVCVCETLDNYFLPPGGSATTRPCDADQDGWVNEEADDPLIQASPPLRANARCTIRSTDRVRLFDEYGISVDILSCSDALKKASAALPDASVPNKGIGILSDGGLMPLSDGGSPCPTILPLRLLETKRNDTPGDPNDALSKASAVYGASTGGRQLEANELNALTKACVSADGDFNDNNTEDINEFQPLGGATDRQRLNAFAYFVELQSASYVNGVLEIRERSRCDDSFPVRYFVADGGMGSYNYGKTLAGGGDMPYWRACSRQRDPFYSQATPRAGFDFAQYECDTPTCVQHPPHPVLVGPPDPLRVLMRDHGLCRLGGMPPADGYWRGMNHASQFKCVNIVAGATANTAERDVSAFGTANGKLTFNNCTAKACTSGADAGCSLPQGTGNQTRQPVITCQPVTDGPLGSIGFAAVNYIPYRRADPTGTTLPPVNNDYSGSSTDYAGGCINEDDFPSAYLCPYPEFSLDKSLADTTFGRYSCYGKGSNYLWAKDSYPDNEVPRATLIWAPTTGSADGGSVLR